MEAGAITQIGVPGAFVLLLMDTVVLESKSKGGKDIATILDPKMVEDIVLVLVFRFFQGHVSYVVSTILTHELREYATLIMIY